MSVIILFVFANLVVLTSAASVFWWLSDYDPKVTGENPKEDLSRRTLRCGISLLLVEAAFWNLWQYWHYNDRVCGVAYLATSLPLALVWAGCISEMVARGFHWLIDPEDKREFDPKEGVRELDVIAGLIRSGRKEEAIKLCQMLKQTEGANVPVLEMMLEHLGVPQPRVKKSKPLTEAYHLRTQGRFQEAELILNSLMAENPRNLEAAMMLMRLYAQDMRRIDKASEVLRLLEQQPHISSAYIDFARHSIVEWSNPRPEKVVAEAQPESIDGLLAEGYFGTAIEILEQKITEQPQDFSLRLKLAEVHAVHCSNIDRAVKIVRDIEASGIFSTDQIQSAKAKLVEWRKIWPRYN